MWLIIAYGIGNVVARNEHLYSKSNRPIKIGMHYVNCSIGLYVAGMGLAREAIPQFDIHVSDSEVEHIMIWHETVSCDSQIFMFSLAYYSNLPVMPRAWHISSLAWFGVTFRLECDLEDGTKRHSHTDGLVLPFLRPRLCHFCRGNVTWLNANIWLAEGTGDFVALQGCSHRHDRRAPTTHDYGWTCSVVWWPPTTRQKSMKS